MYVFVFKNILECWHVKKILSHKSALQLSTVTIQYVFISYLIFKIPPASSLPGYVKSQSSSNDNGRKGG